MKRLIAFVLVFVMVLGLFAGCRNTDNNTITVPNGGDGTTPTITIPVDVPDGSDLEAALAYIKAMYKDAANNPTKDFKRVSVVPVGAVKYNVAWSTNAPEDKVKIIDNGDGTVTIDIGEGVAEDFPYTLTATVSDDKGNTVSITWEYFIPAALAGSQAEIVDLAYALEVGAALPSEVTLTGVITKVNTPYDAGYKNVTVTIVIEGREDKPIMCYRLKGEGADIITLEDTITVTGIIKNYNGTIEFDAGCILDSYVKGNYVAPEGPTDYKEIVDAAYGLEGGDSLPYTSTLVGTITSVDTPYDDGYKNVTVTIAVEGRDDKPIKCYRLKGDGADTLAVDDVIQVTGTLTHYVSSTTGKSSIQFAAGCNLDKIVKKGDGVPPQPEDPDGTVLTVAEAIAKGAAKDHNTYTITKYKVTGVITEVYNTQYGNMKITDGNGNVLTIYGTYNADGTVRYDAMDSKPDAGDTVTLYGVIGQYNDTPQMKNGWILEFTPGDAAPETPTEPENPDVGDTEASPSVNLVTGDKVVIYAPAYSMALSADKVDANSFYNKGVVVSVSDGVMTGYGDAEVWTVTKNSDGSYCFSNGGQNIGLGDQYSSMNLGAVNDKWTLTDLGDGLYLIRNVGRENYIEWYASKNNWSSYNSSSAATDDQFQMSFYVVEAAEGGEGGGDATEPEETVPEETVPEETVPEETVPEETVPEVVEPVVTGPFKMFVEQNKVGKVLYFNGTISNTEFLNTTETMADGVDVYIETKGEEVRFYFMDGETKTFIEIYTNSNNKIRPHLATESSMFYTFNEEVQTYVADINGTDYYLGTYNDFETLSASKTSFITGSNAANVGVSQFIIQFKEAGGENIPEETVPEETVPEETVPEETVPEETVPEETTPAENPVAVKITTLDELTDGQYVMVVSNGYAPTTITSDSNPWLLSQKLTITGDQIENPDAVLLWTITVNGTDVTLTDSNGKTIMPKGGNQNGVKVGSYSWAVTCNNGTFRFAGKGSDTVLLACNTVSENKFRAYKSATVTGDLSKYPADFTLYKLTDGTTVPEETVPEETVPEETVPEETVPEETVPEETVPEETVPEETVPAELPFANGDKIVIYAPAYNKALSADKVNASSFYNKGVDVTITDGVMTGYTDAEVWTVIVNADGTYSFANGDQNIGLADQYSSMNLGAIHDKWTLIDLGNGLYNVRNVGRQNYLEWYSSKNNWSTYNSSSAATDDQFQMSFYVVEKAVTETTVKYTFSEYTAGTQYAVDEVHELDDNITVTTSHAHFTTQLRLYDNADHDGIAIIASKKVLRSVVLNAGYKAGKLAVYGSVDGVNWTLVHEITTTTSYKDYTVEMPEGANYKYMKLDSTTNAQIRVASMTITSG